MNTKQVGDISESFVIANLLKMGYVVLKPFGDNQRYDIVVDRGNGFERVQIKTATYYGDYIKFPCCSSYQHRGLKNKDYVGEIEFFAAYCLELDKVYIVPVDIAPKKEITLRINAVKSWQVKNIRYAEDYELGK